MTIEEVLSSKSLLIDTVNSLKSNIDSFKPLDSDQHNRILQKFRLDWNYHSNAIEGNSLNYGETVALIMHGITAQGKPLKDYLDIQGHNTAIDLILDIAHGKDDLMERDIRALHEVLLAEGSTIDVKGANGQTFKKTIQVGQYKTLPNHVETVTGEIHYYASPEETPAKMADLMDWYRQISNNPLVHPLVIAAIFHFKFVAIHPFDDGNGRMSRLLMNLVLLKNDYPPVVVKQDKLSKQSYYLTLSQADSGDIKPFVEFIANNLINSLELYLKGAKGENIDEESDFDKELSLFKLELDSSKHKVEIKRSIKAQIDIYDKSIEPLITQLNNTVNKLKDFFIGFQSNSIKEENKQYIYSFFESEYFLFHEEDQMLEPKYRYESQVRPYSNYFEYVLNEYLSSNLHIVAYNLDDFKDATKSIDVEIKLFLFLEDFEYSIFYTISEGLELAHLPNSDHYEQRLRLLITNYYHQFLSATEISNFCNTIGQQALSFIKNKYKDPNYNIILVSDLELKNNWIEFASKREISLKIDIDFDLTIIKGKYIQFRIQNMKLEEYVIRLAKYYLPFFISSFNIERGVGFIIEDGNDLPF